MASSNEPAAIKRAGKLFLIATGFALCAEVGAVGGTIFRSSGVLLALARERAAEMERKAPSQESDALGAGGHRDHCRVSWAEPGFASGAARGHQELEVIRRPHYCSL